VADRFGTRGEVMFVFFVMPVMVLITYGLFLAIPKIEPLQKAAAQDGRAYGIICISILALLTAAQVMLTQSLLSGQTESFGGGSPKFILTGLGVFYIVIGNLLPKFRQNFFVGVRTPWTLSSDLSWEKTHRLAGRLFVAGGVLLLITLPFSSFLGPIVLLVGTSLVATLISAVYSYFVWKGDPHKRQ
jgi:uncharacterized membrane protein